jgi:hypothetical protein
MTTTVTVSQKNTYGNITFYPANDLARFFAKVAGTKTLTIDVLKMIKDQGFEVIVISETIKF